MIIAVGIYHLKFVVYEDEGRPYVLVCIRLHGAGVGRFSKGSCQLQPVILATCRMRSDGTPGFLFTNAIDDALMQINTVIRGEDHLSKLQTKFFAASP